MAGLLPIYVRTWRKKLCVYSIAMAILGISLITFGVLALTGMDRISLSVSTTLFIVLFFAEKYTEEEISNFMKIMWKDRDSPATAVTAEQFWDDVQMTYLCCGLNSTDNYNSTVPNSCCANDAKFCSIDNAHKVHCLHAVKGYFDNVLVIILATVAFVMSFVCLVLIILAQFSMRRCGLSNVSESVSVL